MSDRTGNYHSPTGTRRTLRQMTVPAAIAYVIVTVLTLLARVITLTFALVAEIAERVADAGDIARAAARGPVLITSTGGRASTAGGAA
jgi:hypothetical protein